MKIRYLDPLEKLEFELRQLREEGFDISNELNLFDEIRNTITDENDARIRASETLQTLYLKSKNGSNPDDLDEIVRSRPKTNGLTSFGSVKDDDLYDKILGGWLGRAAGCLLGKPIEKYQRTEIREILESNSMWPLNNYFTATGMPESMKKKYPWKRRGGVESLRENIVCMPEDDDLNYTMLNLHIIETHGADFTTENIAESWLRMLPVFETFTAERVAYFNLLNGINPPESGRYLNPFREWIGAQIRADLWGYICLGKPEKAAEFAWRDARLSHTGNGIYGEMFFAAVIAAAFHDKSPLELINIGLSVIPENSRFSQAIRYVVKLVQISQSWDSILDGLNREFGKYHWVHTINNAALTVAALLYNQGDYEKTICNTVMGGWDADCNGATVGSIIGILKGAKALPDKWIKPLDNRIRSSLKGFDNVKISDLARRTLDIVKSMEELPGLKTSLEQTDDY